MYAIWCSVRREFRLRKPCTKSVTEPPVQSYNKKWWREKPLKFNANETEWNETIEMSMRAMLIWNAFDASNDEYRNKKTNKINFSDLIVRCGRNFVVPICFANKVRFQPMDFIINFLSVGTLKVHAKTMCWTLLHEKRLTSITNHNWSSSKQTPLRKNMPMNDGKFGWCDKSRNTKYSSSISSKLSVIVSSILMATCLPVVLSMALYTSPYVPVNHLRRRWDANDNRID